MQRTSITTRLGIWAGIVLGAVALYGALIEGPKSNATRDEKIRVLETQAARWQATADAVIEIKNDVKWLKEWAERHERETKKQ